MPRRRAAAHDGRHRRLSYVQVFDYVAAKEALDTLLQRIRNRGVRPVGYPTESPARGALCANLCRSLATMCFCVNTRSQSTSASRTFERGSAGARARLSRSATLLAPRRDRPVAAYGARESCPLVPTYARN